MSHYLLEASRVVFQVRTHLLPTALKPCSTPKQVSLSKAQAERSFHVFYELLAGLDPLEREQLSLQGPEAYYYLNQVGARRSWMVRPDRGSARAFRMLRGCQELPHHTPAVLCRAEPAGSSAKRMPRTSKGWWRPCGCWACVQRS